MPPRRPILLALSLLTVVATACANDPDLTEAPVEGWTCTGSTLPTTCPDEAYEAQRPLSVDVPLSWSASCHAAAGPPVFVRLPDGLTAVHITVADGTRETGMEIGLDGEAWVSKAEWDAQPYRVLAAPAASALLPNDAGPPPAGCLAILPLVLDPSADGGEARVWIHARQDPSSSTLRVQPVRIGGVELSDEALGELLDHAEERLGDADIALTSSEAAAHDWHEERLVTDPAGLLASYAEPDVLPVFFVERLAGGGLGRAGGIPGAIAPGTASSGVIVALGPSREDGSVNPSELGHVLAHEIAHQLGLFHLTEPAGQPHDVLADTPECDTSYDRDGDGFIAGDECPVEVAGNLLFHTRFDGAPEPHLTVEQIAVLRASPALQP